MVNNIALLVCGTCQGMTRELKNNVMAKHKDILRVVPVDCPAEMNPFVIIKMLRTNWAGIIVACPRNACCCPKNQKVLKRREMVRDLLPVFEMEKERYRIVNVSPFDFSTLDRAINEMSAQINLLENARGFSHISAGFSRGANVPMQIIN